MPQHADTSRQHGARSQSPEVRRIAYRFWFLSLLVVTVAVALAFRYLDVPVAHRVDGLLGATEAIGKGFASTGLLGLEAVLALVLISLRIARGPLSALFEATVLACLTSICAYAINDRVLQLLFGVQGPAVVLLGAPHVFHLFSGASEGSFPSGHMVLAASFAGVFMHLHRKSTAPLAALLLIAAALLVIGDWHFISDVIAGTFLGLSAGLLAGELWLTHSK